MKRNLKTAPKVESGDKDGFEMHRKHDQFQGSSNSHVGQSVFITGLKNVSKTSVVSQNVSKFNTLDKSHSDEQHVSQHLKRGDRSVPEPPKQIIVSKSNLFYWIV